MQHVLVAGRGFVCVCVNFGHFWFVACFHCFVAMGLVCNWFLISCWVRTLCNLACVAYLWPGFLLGIGSTGY